MSLAAHRCRTAPCRLRTQLKAERSGTPIFDGGRWLHQRRMADYGVASATTLSASGSRKSEFAKVTICASQPLPVTRVASAANGRKVRVA